MSFLIVNALTPECTDEKRLSVRDEHLAYARRDCLVRLATIVTDTGTSAARLDNGRVIALPYPDVIAPLRDPDWASVAPKKGISG